SHLGRAHGKAEAWYILDGGRVHLGLRRQVSRAGLAALVAEQRTEELLDLLHPIDVSPGDVVYVPPGVLHAIGGGVFLAELQEPEDLSILLEWRGFALDGAVDGHLGLGFDLAFQAIDLTAPGSVLRGALPAEAERYFRLEHRVVDGETTVGRGFAVLI